MEQKLIPQDWKHKDVNFSNLQTGKTLSRKPYHWVILKNIETITKTAFRNSAGKEGSLNWKPKGMVGYLPFDFQRHGEVLDLELPQGTDKSVFLENAHFIGLISPQIKHELMTLLMTTEAGYKTSIYWSVMFLPSFVEENQQNMGCRSSSRGLNATKHPFFSCENSLINYFVNSMQNVLFWRTTPL